MARNTQGGGEKMKKRGGRGREEVAKAFSVVISSRSSVQAAEAQN
jgi:hypothetical protein